jgi:site-specific DNA-methyltransferase (adenine-specific)
MKTNIILQGDALTKLKELSEQSINMCMTSPPYWALRDYGVDGQLGLEPTFNEYINDLCDIFDEIKRVLRNDGTCWVNLGDTYNAGRNGGHAGGKKCFGDNENNLEAYPKQSGVNAEGISAKSLTMIPQRFAIEMINRGWILRNTIIWHKPNCMPSSAKDRFTVDFEYIFFFSKKKKYYFETQYEPLSKESKKDFEARKKRGKLGWGEGQRGSKNLGSGLDADKKGRTRDEFYNERGRNKRAVWTINPKPFKEAHFAVYPEELCETPIKSGCPNYLCKKCGKPRKKIMKVSNLKEGSKAELIVKDDPYAVNHRKGTIMVRQLPREQEIIDFLRKWKGDITYKEISKHTGLAVTSVSHWFSDIESTHGFSYPTKKEWLKLKDIFQFSDKYDKAMTKEYVKPAGVMDTEYEFEGLSDCGCNAGFDSGIVLDPFFGAGTTGLVALKQNKKFIGIELNPEYIEIAKKRLKPFLEQTSLTLLK